MNDYDKDGYWWLPENPDNQVVGRLFFGHQTRSELRLVGSFRGTFDALRQMGMAGVEYRPEIILGITGDGKKYTLFDCCNFDGQFGTFVRESFLPAVVFEGKHFEKSDEIIFHQMTIRVAHLEDWYQTTGKKMTIPNPEAVEQKILFEYQKPPALKIQFVGGSLEFGHDLNTQFPRPSRDFVLAEKGCVSLKPDRPIHFDEFLKEFMSPIHRFLELGVGKELTLLEVRGKSQSDCGSGTKDEVRKAPAIQLYWEKDFQKDNEKELFTPFMVFTFPDIRDELEDFVRQWVQSYREIKPVMQLFFGKVLRRESYTANSFLNSVQAAESYHRYRRGGTDLPEEEHTLRVQSILESCPEEHKSWLEKRLTYSNEIGLRKRLSKLLSERAGLLDISSKQIKKMANRITEIRNYFTHYSGEKDPDFATGADLYHFDTLMQWTVMACLLEEMGMTRDRAHELIRRNQSFIHFKRVELHKGVIELIKVEEVSRDEAERLESETGEPSNEDSKIDSNESEKGMKGTGSQ